MFNYIYIKNFINQFLLSMPDNARYGKQKFKFKVFAALDPEVKECLKFETKKIEYDMGHKFKYNIKSIINFFFGGLKIH